ncbi:hypothetical protein IE53DRAFT_111482 [Violaceomyces palustris]|uniref:Uncharacterized protein n=1 Tax=Violaceomyces palustris TaxID=1673888 RepID=A0ACD0NWD3_9BASI|nr:hypothetical protein IE53DRAFT_111482 [Violaceomyces palustris]
MPIGALEVVILLSLESYKASLRRINKRRSKKHGYNSLPTDSCGRPVNEKGERLSRNQARALCQHQRELERIRTAEREWRMRGDSLPSAGVVSTTPVSNPTNPLTVVAATDLSPWSHPTRSTVVNAGSASSLLGRSHLSMGQLPTAIHHHQQDVNLFDVIEHDGEDWRRVVWEGSPIYSEVEPHREDDATVVGDAGAQPFPRVRAISMV